MTMCFFFKQKTAYEMLRSLVGSEMCIRDRHPGGKNGKQVTIPEDGYRLRLFLSTLPEWDLPGGVVEMGEAPAHGLVRELREELGITVEVHGLITVNWLPAWREWDDACIFLFDLGIVDSTMTASMELQATEIKSVQWCDVEAVRANAALAAIELLDAVELGRPSRMDRLRDGRYRQRRLVATAVPQLVFDDVRRS